MAATVEIYTKFACPFCVTAKRLLQEKGAEFTEIDVTLDADKRGEMVARVPGARTVPQIIIDGVAVGGSDDLRALEDAGKLDAMLDGSAGQ